MSKKIILLVASILSVPFHAQAQTTNNRLIFVTVDPSNGSPCNRGTAMQYNTTNNNLWGCDGNWNFAGTVGPTGPAGTNGAAGSFTLLNDTGTGTILHSLAKVDPSGHALITATTDTVTPVFVVNAGAGTSGSATLAIGGDISLTMDAGGAVIQHYIINSTATAGRGMDSGIVANGSNSPPAACVVGIAQTSAAANAAANVVVTGCGGSGGGTVTSVAASVPSWLTVSGSPITGAGTLTITPTTAQTSHQVIGTCNSTTTFAPCLLVLGDLPSGIGLTANPLSQFAATTSAQLAGVITDETGTGLVVFNNSPTFITPVLGIPASGDASNLTKLPITLTTTGSSGAATYTQATNTLNIPQYTGGGGSGCTTSGTNKQILVDNGAGGCTSTTSTVDTTAGLAGGIGMPQGTPWTPAVNSVVLQAPASVSTAFTMVTPAASATGVLHATNSSNVDTLSISSVVNADIANSTIDLTAKVTGVLPQANFTQVSPTAGTSVSLTSGVPQMFVCTSTCTVTVPAPAAGAQYCVYNDDNVSTVITLSAIGSGAHYENTARTAYGTAGTGTFVSGGAVGDAVCIVFRDSTHYSTLSHAGTFTAN